VSAAFELDSARALLYTRAREGVPAEGGWTDGIHRTRNRLHRSGHHRGGEAAIGACMN